MREVSQRNGAGSVDPQVVLLDIAFLVFGAAYALIILLWRDNVADWLAALRELAIAGVLIWVSSILLWRGRSRRGGIRAAIRAFIVMVACGILFKVAERLQHVFVAGWMDNWILSLDRFLWGMEASVALQPFVHPLLTEWMMFAYLAYFPLLPFMVIVCVRSGSEKPVHEYLLNLSFAYLISFAGFMLFPLATQMHFNPTAYTVPLDGWVFTWLGDLLRTHLHEAGAALPSPHCAAGTVMLMTSHRYSRRTFHILLPIIITLYVSTVYCRYHYVWDTIAGILVGFVVVKMTPALVHRVEYKQAFPFFTLREAKS